MRIMFCGSDCRLAQLGEQGGTLKDESCDDCYLYADGSMAAWQLIMNVIRCASHFLVDGY